MLTLARRTQPLVPGGRADSQGRMDQNPSSSKRVKKRLIPGDASVK